MAKKPEKKMQGTDIMIREGAGPITADASVLRDRIAQKAFELFQKRGEAHGHDVEDWLEAERLITVEFRTSGKRP